MCTIVVALEALVLAGAAERLSVGDLEAAALEMSYVCDDVAPSFMGPECVLVTTTLWAMETGTPSGPSFSRPERGQCGPLQVIPSPGHQPPCGVIRWAWGEGFRAGIGIFRTKWLRVGPSSRRAFAAYNGATRAESYGRRAERLFRMLSRKIIDSSGELCLNRIGR